MAQFFKKLVKLEANYRVIPPTMGRLVNHI